MASKSCYVSAGTLVHMHIIATALAEVCKVVKSSGGGSVAQVEEQHGWVEFVVFGRRVVL